MTKVLITGGTGLVGQRLSRLLLQRGFEIQILSRSKSGMIGGIRHFKWSVKEAYIEENALDAEYIIHLAGAGVAEKRWTSGRKRELLESRTLPTSLLLTELLRTNSKPQSIVCASAVGYYGNRGNEILDENAGAGKDFLADVCQQWEAASSAIEPAAGIPTAILRIGIVLSSKGGALPEISKPIKMGIGAYIGDGTQHYPWIHIDDLCEMILYCLEKKKTEIYNAVAPYPETNKSMSKIIAHVLGKPFIPAPAPALLLKLILGEKAAIVLNSQNASADKIIKEGFRFNYPNLEQALRDIYRREV